MISFFAEDIDFNLKEKNRIKKWLRAVAEQLARPVSRQIGDLNYIFCSDEYLLKMNIDYLGHDYYTDVITFDNSNDIPVSKSKPSKVSGDIFISIDRIRANGIEYGEGFEKELLRVIVHGLLHLIGYDETSAELQAEMRAAEDKALMME